MSDGTKWEYGKFKGTFQSPNNTVFAFTSREGTVRSNAGQAITFLNELGAEGWEVVLGTLLVYEQDELLLKRRP